MPKIYISDKYKFIKRIKALSFFTGTMGLDIGLKKSGIDVILECKGGTIRYSSNEAKCYQNEKRLKKSPLQQASSGKFAQYLFI